MTDPDLEAAIEQNPDDDASYLVYGDWLQARDDPRGEWIALSAAALQAPDDDKLAQRADRHFKQHASTLIGELGKTKGVTLGWHLGFVRDARFAIGDAAKPGKGDLDMLRALLAHPSGRFVQTITIARPHGFTPADVVALLLAERKPTTLADLRIGRSWDHTSEAPELREVFPRLAGALDVEWQRIARVLAKQRKATLGYDSAKLPELELRARPTEGDDDEPADGDGGPITDPDKLLAGIKLELEKQPALGILAAIKRSFTPASVDQFAVALAEQFRQKESTKLKWGLDAIGYLGGDRAVEWLARQVADWTHPRAMQCVQHMRRIGGQLATWELYGIVMDPALRRPRRDDSERLLEGNATSAKVALDVLLDRSLPPLGVAGVRLQQAQERRLRDHLIDGRRMGAREFLRYFATHPRMSALAARVLWATYEGTELESTFRVDDSGCPRDVAGKEVDLDGATVGVLHPAELPEDDRDRVLDAWRKVFRDTKVEPLLDQLSREVYTLRDGESDDKDLVRFKLRNVGFGRLRAGFENELDWRPITEDYDQGDVTIGWWRRFPRDGVIVQAMLADGNASIGVVRLLQGNARPTWGKLRPITVSEVLYALERATTRERAAAQIDEVSAGDGTAIERGMRVRITFYPGKVRDGVVFWLGDGDRGPRCGVRGDDGETHWADLAWVRVLDEPAPAADAPPDEAPAPAKPKPKKKASNKPAAKAAAEPAAPAPAPAPAAGGALAFAKGSKVQWKAGRNTGTGVAFWIGKNKFGDGMRVGIKDDETGETVWANADDCQPS